MEHKKLIFVTGITGKQGGAVARHLLEQGHGIIGLTRDANSEKANHWKNQGVQIVEGNLNDASAYLSELKKSDAIYFVQSLQKKHTEIHQGKQFIDTLQSNGIKHVVYASVLGADLNTGVPHFDSKNEIEKHLKSSNINYTIIRPASFYENYLMPQVANKIKKGTYMSPLNKNCTQQMIGVDDIGKITSQVILNPQNYSNKTLSVATDEYQIGNVPKLFSEAIQMPVTYRKLPRLIVRLAMGHDLYKMFEYMNHHDFCEVKNVQEVRDEFHITGDFRYWVNQNFTAHVNMKR